jgi:L-rhamnose isomerase
MAVSTQDNLDSILAAVAKLREMREKDERFDGLVLFEELKSIDFQLWEVVWNVSDELGL